MGWRSGIRQRVWGVGAAAPAGYAANRPGSQRAPDSDIVADDVEHQAGLTGSRLIAACLLIGAVANATFIAISGWSTLWFDGVWVAYALYASRLGNPIRRRWRTPDGVLLFTAIISYIPPYNGVSFWLFVATFFPLALFVLATLSILRRLEPSQTTPPGAAR